jgi:uncharacterized protein (TIGR02271 family)
MARKKRNSADDTATTDRTDMWTHRDSSAWRTSDVTGFDVEAVDGAIGSVDEATYDAGSSYVVVDTGPWIFGRKVVLPAGVIYRVDTEQRRVWVNQTKDQIENAPEFDELRYRDDDYRTEVGTYYHDLGGYADTDRDLDRTDRDVLERSEEQLTVDKRTEQAGSVRVGKRVVEEQQSVDVPVTREEVTLERRSVDRPATGDSFDEASVDVPVYQERVTSNKEARVVEELELGKTKRTDTERVSDTVRREEFDIDAVDNTRRP